MIFKIKNFLTRYKNSSCITIFLIIIKAWLYASVSILIISMCGLSGVILIPLTKSPYYKEILRFLISIAIGTLCGDALMVHISIKNSLN